MKIVLRKPEHLEKIFGGNFSKLRENGDVSIRNTLLEQKLRPLLNELVKFFKQNLIIENFFRN